MALLLAALAGTALGLLTGLVPGLHANLFAALAVSQQAFLAETGLSPGVAVFLLSLAVSQSCADIIPSMLLAVDEEGAVSAFPAQKLAERGFALEAVRLWLQGSVAGLLLAALASRVLLVALPLLMARISPYKGWILLALCAKLLDGRDVRGTIRNVSIFLLAGCLGIIAFTQPGLKEPVFPLMSGLFGCASLLLQGAEGLPRQQSRSIISLSLSEWGRILSGATLSSLVLALLPGVGRSQAAALSLALSRFSSTASIALVGAVATMSLGVSVLSLVSLGKARDGAVIAAGAMVQPDSSLLGWMLLSAALASLAVLLFARRALPVLERIPRRGMSLAVLALVSALVGALCGWQGLPLLLAASALGVLCVKAGVKRRMLLGCLLLPVLLYSL